MRAQQLDFAARQPGGNETTHQLDIGLFARHLAGGKVFQNLRFHLPAHCVERAFRAVVGHELDQRRVALLPAAVLHVGHQVLHQDGAADEVAESGAGRLAYRFAHFLDGEIAGARVRVRFPLGIDLEADGVVDFYPSAVFPIVVREVGVECHRVEPFGEVEPAIHAFGNCKWFAWVEFAKDVLNLLDAERRADRDEKTHVAFALLKLAQDVIGDHRALAMADDDERGAAVIEAFAHCVFHATALVGVEEEIAHILEEHFREQARHPAAHALGQRQHLCLRAFDFRAALLQMPFQRRHQAPGLGIEFRFLLARFCQRAQGRAGIRPAGQVLVGTGAGFRQGVAVAVDPVGEARAVAHRRAEQCGIPLALENGGDGFVADAVDIHDRDDVGHVAFIDQPAAKVRHIARHEAGEHLERVAHAASGITA